MYTQGERGDSAARTPHHRRTWQRGSARVPGRRLAAQFAEEIELVRWRPGERFDVAACTRAEGMRRRYFFGSAINNFGRRRGAAGGGVHRLRARARCRARRASAACCPKKRHSPASCSRSRPTWIRRTARPHRVPAASRAGRYARGMRLFHVRLDKEVRVADALTFMAADRAQAEEAWAGDIIEPAPTTARSISATPCTQGERLYRFTGVPGTLPRRSSPRRSPKDPLRARGAAERPGAAVQGRCHAAVPAAAQQRADSSARWVRCSSRSWRSGCRTKYGVPVRVRAGDGAYRALGRERGRSPSSPRVSHPRPRQSRARSPARWCSSRALARQPATDAGALAGRRGFPRDPHRARRAAVGAHRAGAGAAAARAPSGMARARGLRCDIGAPEGP